MIFLYWKLLGVLAVGYLFGSFLSAEILAQTKYKLSLFEEGSGNPGMANTARVLGKKAAAFVLLGDILKTLLAMALCMLLFPGLDRYWILVCGIGVTLGHDFPFWHHFKGGKGVATICTTIIVYSPVLGIISCLAGLLCVICKLGLKIGAGVISGFYFILICFTQNIPAIICAFILMVLMIERNCRKTKLDEIKPAQEN